MRSYTGRVHRVYVTRNTEYHVLGDLCIAVRDRRGGVWRPEHPALGRRIKGSIRVLPGDAWELRRGMPRRGSSIYFSGDGPITSEVEHIRIPTPRELTVYHRLGFTGTG